MAFKKNRQESLYYGQLEVIDSHGTVNVGHTFKVGDGVHVGLNGDRYPLTVVRISDSGREVVCSYDTYKIIDNYGPYTESDRLCEFTTVQVPKEQLVTFKLTRDMMCFKRGLYVLRPERRYAQNPHV